MKIRLTWSTTNDYLLFDAINEQLALWFIQTSQRLGNQYSTADMVTDIPHRAQDTIKLIDEITTDIERVNKFLVSMKQQPVLLPTDWYDQTQLNALHKNWARTRYEWPKLSSMLYKIDPALFDSYHRMNCHIHLIENSFEYHFRDPSHWRVDNPFKDIAYQWEHCHLAVKYPGHGREAFEKFRNLDDNTEDMELDNCNWDNIDPALTVNLTRPYTINPPEEFLAWCRDKNLMPHTNTIPLGNLVNWRSELTNARVLFTKNIRIPENYFSLTAD